MKLLFFSGLCVLSVGNDVLAASSAIYTDTHGSTTTVSGHSTSANYSNYSSMGQSVVVGDSSSSTYSTRMGFFTVALASAAPVFTSSTSINVTEGSTAVQTLTATDADNTVDQLSYNITGGADQAVFSLDSSSGALSFKTAPDFDATTDTNSNNQYEVTVQVSDGARTGEQTLTVTVTDTALTLSAGQQYIIPLTSSNGRSVGTVSTSGDDATEFSLSAGNDNGAFTINSTGAITVADATALSAGSQTLTVTASDGTTPVTDTVAVFVIDSRDLTRDSDSSDNGIGEALEQTFGSDDTDSDGIPDALESLAGFDIDATTDTDGDGTPDVIEILNGRNPAVDDNAVVGAPKIMAETPKALLAKGILSAYTLDELSVVANDGDTPMTPEAYYALGQCKEAVPYNYQAVCTPVATTGYTSGTHQIWWLTTDVDNNWATAPQTLNILPQISFRGDLTLAGTPGSGNVTTQLVLSGAALNTQAFTIPFTLGGTGRNPTDHDLVAGQFTVQPGQTVSEPLTITLGSAPVDGADIEILLDTTAAVFAESDATIDTDTQFVTAAEKTTQTIQISQNRQYAPRLSAFKGTLNSIPEAIEGLVFAQSHGDTVTLSFDLTDPDGGDYQYRWNGSDIALNLPGETSATPTIDISTLAAGEYYVEVMVTDTTAPEREPAILGAMIKILEISHLSSTLDTDGDGRPDAEEGLGDSDGDGRPDYLDAQNELANVVPTDAGDQQSYLVKAKPGIRIIYGTTAVAANTGDTKISTEDLAEHGDKGQPVNDAEPVNASLAHLFDYEVENMDVPADPLAEGYTIDVVFPLDAPLAADSTFLKYDTADSWVAFVSDTHNQVAWTTWHNKAVGVCPDPASASYTTDITLKAGANCVQITIQDGGPHDADGVVNGRIIDPFGIAGADETNVTIHTENNGGSGGGLVMTPVGLFFGFLLSGIVVLRRRFTKLLEGHRRAGK